MQECNLTRDNAGTHTQTYEQGRCLIVLTLFYLLLMLTIQDQENGVKTAKNRDVTEKLLRYDEDFLGVSMTKLQKGKHQEYFGTIKNGEKTV